MEAVNENETDTRAEMAQYDLYYVKNWSLLLDVKIFFMTVGILMGAKRADDAHRAPKMLESEVITKEL